MKLTSMNRPRSEGVRATRVRVTEMGVVPAAVSPQILEQQGWTKAPVREPGFDLRLGSAEKSQKQSSWRDLQFGIFFGQWHSSCTGAVEKTGPWPRMPGFPPGWLCVLGQEA